MPCAASSLCRRIRPRRRILPWNRLAHFDPVDLDAAFLDRTVVKASLMRIALHVVHAEDYREFHNAMQPMLRASRLTDCRTISTARSRIAVGDLLAPLARFVARPRTGAEVQDMLEALLGERNQNAWRALRTCAPLHRANWRAIVLWHGVVIRHARAKPGPASSVESVQLLIRRFLQGFGPASA